MRVSRKRLQIHTDNDDPFWSVSCGRGADEFCNPSIYFTWWRLYIVIFYGRRIERNKWWYSGSVDDDDTTYLFYVSPDYCWDAKIPKEVLGLDYDAAHAEHTIPDPISWSEFFALMRAHDEIVIDDLLPDD